MSANDPTVTGSRVPTADECSDNAEIWDDNGTLLGYACWYPQMGGYIAKAVAVPDPGGCVDLYVWHDGEFPFDGHCQVCSTPRTAVRLHHCDGNQFVSFGQFLNRIATDQ